MKTEKPVGLTRDAGWQFGLRKTFPYPKEAVWNFLFSEEGLQIWLGKTEKPPEINQTYRTREGIEGQVRVFVSDSHIRLTWKPKAWANGSALQLRVTGDDKKSTIVFHHDKLADADQREEVQAYWNEKMEAIGHSLSALPR